MVAGISVIALRMHLCPSIIPSTKAAALRPPIDTNWRLVGRPRTIWLRTIDEDLQYLNFEVHTTWSKARDRDVWHQVVRSVGETATSGPVTWNS